MVETQIVAIRIAESIESIRSIRKALPTPRTLVPSVPIRGRRAAMGRLIDRRASRASHAGHRSRHVSLFSPPATGWLYRPQPEGRTPKHTE